MRKVLVFLLFIIVLGLSSCSNEPSITIWEAVSTGNISEVEKHIANGTDLNQQSLSESTPLIDAVFFNQYEVAKLLLEEGVDTGLKKNDGTTAIYLASYFCNIPMVELLLDYDVDITIENNTGDVAYSVASSDWSEGLEASYQIVGEAINFQFDIERIKVDRVVVAGMLEEYMNK